MISLVCIIDTGPILAASIISLLVNGQGINHLSLIHIFDLVVKDDLAIHIATVKMVIIIDFTGGCDQLNIMAGKMCIRDSGFSV